MWAGLWGSRGLNEIVNIQGVGFYFTLTHQGQEWERFFYNVGQPDAHPAVHSDHIDDSRFCDAINITGSEFAPWKSRYSLFDNTFFWFEQQEVIILHADIKDSITLCADQAVEILDDGWIRLSPGLYLWGVSWGEPISGNIRLLLSRSIFPEVRAWIDGVQTPKIRQITTPLQISMQAVFYNLSVSPRLKHHYYVPVNKAWQPMIARVTESGEWGQGPMIFAWDASFSCIILSRFDLSLAEATFFSLMEGLQPDGRLPQLRVGDRFSNRSNPPIWFPAAIEIYKKSGDRDFLVRAYPLLLQNYQWWKRCRMNPDYTYSWGTDNEDDQSLILLTGKTGAVYESGLDDSPVLDTMELIPHHKTEGVSVLDQSCIDLSSLMVLAAEILDEMSLELGLQASPVEQDLLSYRSSIHKFFDVENKKVNSFKEGYWNEEISPLIFYPLLTSCINSQEIDLLVEYFHSSHFKKHFPLPSLSRKSPYFQGDGDYWRGRIWPPLLWLLAYGCQKQGLDIYQDIKHSAELLLLQEWEREGHIHENYSFETGRGEAEAGTYARSCPFYSWGALLGII